MHGDVSVPAVQMVVADAGDALKDIRTAKTTAIVAPTAFGVRMPPTIGSLRKVSQPEHCRLAQRPEPTRYFARFVLTTSVVFIPRASWSATVHTSW